MKVAAAIILTLACVGFAAIWLWVLSMTSAFAGGAHLPHSFSDLCEAPSYYGVLLGAPLLIIVFGLLAARLWKISRTHAPNK
jgi:hypothetical protein